MIDWSRPVRTADDRVVRLIADNLGGPAPFAVAVTMANGSERVFRVDEDGVSPENANLNLKNLFIDDTAWVNVYTHPNLGLVSSRSYETEADAVADVRGGRLVGRNQITLRAVFD